MQGLSWSFDLPESRLRKSRWRRNLIKKHVFGNFSKRFCSLCSVFFAWIGLPLCQREVVLTAVLIPSSRSSVRATQLKNKTKKVSGNARRTQKCGAGGKPSTMFTAGKLVKHSLLAATWFSKQALRSERSCRCPPSRPAAGGLGR